MSVTVVSRDGTLRPGKPVPWTAAPVSNLAPGRSFDMLRDGSRALIVQMTERAAPARESVVFAFNFFEQLKRIGP